MAKVTRTLILQVHNPSNNIKATLHRSMRAYTNSARAVLDAASREWSTVREQSLLHDKLNGMKLATNLRVRYRSLTVNHHMHSSLREALFADLASTILSYDALITDWSVASNNLRAEITEAGYDPDSFPRRRDGGIPPERQKEYARLYRKIRALGRPPSFPTAPRTVPDYKGYEAMLDDLVENGSVEPRRNPRLDQAILTGTRPLTFPRPDGPSGSRNFAMVRSQRDGRYYAMLYLFPAGDHCARPLAVPPPTGKRGVLKALNRAGLEIPRRPEKRSCAILLPMACGSWHERTALQDALSRPESIRVAKLIHTPAHRRFSRYVPERFDLAVTFEHLVPDAGIPQAHMAILMDEQSRITWIIRDSVTGEILDEGIEMDLVELGMRWREDRRMQAREGRLPPRAHHIQAEQVKHALHIMINRLVRRAQDRQALVAVCDNTYLRTIMRVAPLDTGTGKSSSRSEQWHEAAAERNYRRTTLVVGELQRILNYKLVMASLCRPLSVRGISPRDCASCGTRGNERDRCAGCGAALDARNTVMVTLARVPEIVGRIEAARLKREAAHTAEEARND